MAVHKMKNDPPLACAMRTFSREFVRFVRACTFVIRAARGSERVNIKLHSFLTIYASNLYDNKTNRRKCFPGYVICRVLPFDIIEFYYLTG